MDTSTIVLIYYLLINLALIKPIKITICDCMKPVTSGLLDLNDPEYSFQNQVDREENEKVLSKPISYRIATKEETEFKIEGLVCSQWMETKRITGNFWLGSYDTEYLHTTKEVSSADCWKMKLQFECAGNRNAVNGKTYSYIHKPTGDGKWMSVKEYSVVNCLAQEIELRRNRVGGPILSPFGSHNVSLGVDHLIVNHNTIVWIEPNKIVDDSVAKFTFFGTGQLSIIKLGIVLKNGNHYTYKQDRETDRFYKTDRSAF
jgi:hypothetical protein